MRPKVQYLSSGPAVADLQNLLNRALPQAQPKLVADGRFGDRTLQRVKAYQHSRGLVVDGVVGAKTWAALDAGAPAKAPLAGAPAPGPGVGTIEHVAGLLYDGAALKCSNGTQPGMLRVPGPRRPACIGDCKAGLNVTGFGECRSQSNAMVLAQSAAFGVLTPVTCKPMLSGPWSWKQTVKNGPGGPVLGNVVAGNPPQPAITRGSLLMCGWNGVIKAV